MRRKAPPRRPQKRRSPRHDPSAGSGSPRAKSRDERSRRDTEQFLDARRTLSGIEWFRKVLSGEVPRVPMLKLLGMRLLEVDRGRVVFGATPRAAHYNGVGVAHGGFAATLLDSALGCAINTMTPPGVHFTTLELKINYTRAIVSEIGPLRCEATVVHMGSRTATAEGRVVDRTGRVYAHGTTTCIVWEPPPSASPRRGR